MILCPNCQHHEITGALFCSECGTQLVFTERFSTTTLTGSSPQPAEATSTVSSVVRPNTGVPTRNPDIPVPVANMDAFISLHLVDSGKILPLAGRTEFTMGRVAEGQPILPDIDLSPYDAYTQGVSRLHAVLKLPNRKVSIMDLGSSNGTRVNGQKIVPNTDFPLNHGDIIALGKLKIQILIRS